MSSQYRLERTTLNSSWDEFVESSPNGTVFSLSEYLKCIDQTHALYYCYKKQEKRAAVAVMEAEDGTSAVFHDYVIYNGVMYAPAANKQNQAQIHSEQFKISECVATELAGIYQNVTMSLHPSIRDIRPFLWYEYGSDLPKYSPDIRYTSHIDISFDSAYLVRQIHSADSWWNHRIQ